MEYREGSIIVYRNFAGQSVRVAVVEKSDDIKGGRPGFDGVPVLPNHVGPAPDSDSGAWGYDSQITQVERY